MKKICIATWYGPANFGTGLQAVALSQYLINSGYEVSYVEDKRNINTKTKISQNKDRLYIIKELLSGRWLCRRKYKKDFIEKRRLQKQFLEKYSTVFSILSNDDEQKINDTFDIFIAGGDQIWNPSVYENVFLLSMANDEKIKISYGTSVGVKEIPNKLKDVYKTYLNRLSYISVRERQSAEALRTFIEKDIAVVVDPTFLLSADEWEFLLKDAEINEKEFAEPYILCYFVGTRKSYWKYVEKVHKSTGYRVVVIPINNEAYVNRFDKYVKVSPAEFLWLIKHATIVCTDSFHATVFSIQYDKEFYTLKRFLDESSDSQNGRLQNLLSAYQLDSRLICNEKKFVRNREIDYDRVKKVLQEERIRSIKWLQTALKSE
ncbi:MAG: polysaccharide pyruvyl transferase family protein [Lachnospiraceae bacterium]